LPLLDRNGWKADAFARDPAADAPIVPFAELEAALAAGRPGARIGVDLPNNIHPREVLPWQDRLDLIAIAFPRFSDGRGFSLGRMLREQSYRGLLRASGWVIPDQFAFALHCGFDEVEIDEEHAARQPIEQWLHAAGLISESYQDTRDGFVSVFKQRRAAKEAA
jgi:uncharacterized protein (DUF934 family)